MKAIIEILHNGNYSCVVENYNEIHIFSQRGIADLYDMIKNKPCFLKEACVADRVVGKAAAALMILGEVKEVYADVISLSALILLRESGLEVEFGRVVPFIWNYDKTDLCLLERICYDEFSADAIFLLIEKFISKIEVNKVRELVHI